MWKFWRAISFGKGKLKCYLRTMAPRDLSEVLKIETDSFNYPWTVEDFGKFMRKMDCVSIVAESDDEVIGYIICECFRNKLHITNLAVHPSYRRKGIGKQLIANVMANLTTGRERIIFEVSEENLDAHLFLSNCGFKAIQVLGGFYDDFSDPSLYQDAYLFEHKI